MTENETNDFSRKELVKVVTSGIGEPTPGFGLGVIDREAKSFHFFEKEKRESDENCVKEKEKNELIFGWDNLQNDSASVVRPRLIFVRSKYDELETPIRMNTQEMQTSENSLNKPDDSQYERKDHEIEKYTNTLKEEEDGSFTVDDKHITLKNASDKKIRNSKANNLDKHSGTGHGEKSMSTKQKADDTRSSICLEEKNNTVKPNTDDKHNKLCRGKKCGSAKANIDEKHCRLGSLKPDSDGKPSSIGPGEKCGFSESDNQKKYKNPDKKRKQTKRKTNRKTKQLSDEIKEKPKIDSFKLESVFTDKPINLYVGLGMQLSPRIRLSPLPIKPKVHLDKHQRKRRVKKPPERKCSEKTGNGVSSEVVINVRSTEEKIGQSKDNLRLRWSFKKRHSGSVGKIESVDDIKESKSKADSIKTAECSTSCEDSHDTVRNYFKEIVITDVNQLVPINADSATKEADTSVQNSETQTKSKKMKNNVRRIQVREFQNEEEENVTEEQTGPDIAETEVDEPSNKAKSKFKVRNLMKYIDGKMSKFRKLLKN